MSKVALRAGEFHYRRAGAGADVVLVHAVTGNLSIWMFGGACEALEPHFRVTAYDLRGHGHSVATSTGYTSADMADDFAQLHDALALQPAILVGHSFGGVVAMHAAVRWPDKVRGVVICDSFFPGLRHIEPNFDRANVWTDLRDSFARCGLSLGDEVSFAELFAVVGKLTPDHLEQLKREMGPGSMRWLAQLPKLAATSCGKDVLEPAGLDEAALASVRQPVVALYDEHSPFHATAAHLESTLARCRLRIVPGAKHVAVLQNAEAFNALVLAAARELDGEAN